MIRPVHGAVAAVVGAATIGVGYIMYRKFIPRKSLFDVTLVKNNLNTVALGKRISFKEVVPTTMTWADSEGAHGDVFVADAQTDGVGRRGRVWSSQAGGNLYMSFIWAPSSSSKQQHQMINEMLKLNFAICIAICKAGQENGANGLAVKWPNDVWYDEQKVSGMIVNFDGKSRAVAGVGVNINFAPDVTDNGTTSLAQIAGQFIRREKVLSSFLNHLETLMESSFAEVLEEYKQFDMLVGKQIRVFHKNRQTDSEADYDAIVVGFGKMGGLIVSKLSDNQSVELSGEEISVRPKSGRT